MSAELSPGFLAQKAEYASFLSLIGRICASGVKDSAPTFLSVLTLKGGT